MSKPNFTPGPWQVHDKTYGEHRLISVVSDSPMVIIANMPKRYDKLGDEWEKAFNIDEVAANAALIAECPALYENEERNLRELTTILHFLELVTKNCEMNIVMRITALGGIVEIKERIKTTEQLLSKCRGEEKNDV